MEELTKKGVILGVFYSAIGFLALVIIIQFSSIDTIGIALLSLIFIFAAYRRGYTDGLKMVK